MVPLKYFLLIAGIGGFLVDVGVVAYDVYKADSYRRLLARGAANRASAPKPAAAREPGLRRAARNHQETGAVTTE